MKLKQVKILPLNIKTSDESSSRTTEPFKALTHEIKNESFFQFICVIRES